MQRVNFRSTGGILEQLESAVSNVEDDRQSIELARTKIIGCKHAIQIYALSMEHARMMNIVPKKLKKIEME